MSMKAWIPLCAAAALLSACGPRDENKTDPANDAAATPGTPSTPANTPPAETPPASTSPTDTPPPAETPPADAPPDNPPPPSGQ
jgi:hypothetical protein